MVQRCDLTNLIVILNIMWEVCGIPVPAWQIGFISLPGAIDHHPPNICQNIWHTLLSLTLSCTKGSQITTHPNNFQNLWDILPSLTLSCIETLSNLASRQSNMFLWILLAISLPFINADNAEEGDSIQKMSIYWTLLYPVYLLLGLEDRFWISFLHFFVGWFSWPKIRYCGARVEI